MVVDTVTGWRARTGHQQSFGIPGGTFVNRLGMRGPDLPRDKPAGERRVLLVGDSTVFGVLVADADIFARRAEVALQGVDPAIRVLNGAAPGWSSWQARRALEERLGELEPDLLVIATLWSDAQGAREPDAVRFTPISPLLARSHAYVLLREWVNELRSGGRVEEVKVGLLPPGPGGRGAPTLRVPLDAYRDNLEAMAAQEEAMGGQVAFLVLPCVRDPAGGGVGDFRDDYRQAMRQAAERYGAPIADTPAAFVGTSPSQLFLDEVHPTAAGHAVVAEVLAQALDGWAREGAATAR